MASTVKLDPVAVAVLTVGVWYAWQSGVIAQFLGSVDSSLGARPGAPGSLTGLVQPPAASLYPVGVPGSPGTAGSLGQPPVPE
ncbi:MAG: hypothetical protein ACRD15_17735, partial [Vicinamibacterales bacterium]